MVWFWGGEPSWIISTKELRHLSLAKGSFRPVTSQDQLEDGTERALDKP